MLSQDITGLLHAVRMKYTFTYIYLLTYLWVQGSIQTWTNCRLQIAYCCGLRMWIFDQTLWTDADQILTIKKQTRRRL